MGEFLAPAVAFGVMAGVFVWSFGDPESVPPTIQVGLGYRMSWFSRLAGLPTRSVDEQDKVDRFQAEIAAFQNPDRDT